MKELSIQDYYDCVDIGEKKTKFYTAKTPFNKQALHDTPYEKITKTKLEGRTIRRYI